MVQAGPDPKLWKCTGGERVSDPTASNAPNGSYAYLSLLGYSNHEDRYIPTRSPEHTARMSRADALAAKTQQAQEVA